MSATDPLTLAVIGWLTSPRLDGTLTLRLSTWYGRWTADAVGHEDQ